jgi:acetyltransferase-like isoleucine patch superfamily enzyme
VENFLDLTPLDWLKQLVRTRRLRQRFPGRVIYPGAVVDPTSSLGAHTVLFRNAAVLDSTVGAYTYIQAESSLYRTDVGAFCSIASGVTLGLVDHPTHMVSTSPVFYDHQQPLPKFFTDKQHCPENSPRTTIGADVWIGQGVMVKAGICIGPGAVIGAGAVVTKDIPAYAIAAGVPCRVIHSRFSDEMCQRLLDSRWWEYSDTRLAELAPLFVDPAAFLHQIKNG